MNMLITFFEKLNIDPGLVYVLIRTAIIYIFAIILFRFSGNRFRLQAPFDFVVIVILGAVLGRTIYGDVSLVATISASVLIIIIHELFAKLAYHSKFFGFLVKGRAKQLILNGELNRKVMQMSNITEEDLLEVCHKELKMEKLSMVKKARLERNGEITMVLKRKTNKKSSRAIQ